MAAPKLIGAEPEPTKGDALADQAAGLEHFEKKIRPLLVAKCQKCHGAGPKEPKGNLRLNSAAGLQAGGDTGATVVPGKPDESLLVEAINYTNVDLQMPPDGKLSAEQIADFTQWIKLGAPWRAESGTPEKTEKAPFDLAARKAAHWAWRPVVAPALPDVRQAGWCSDPLDRFILVKLEEKSLEPAPKAGRRTLIRRLYFDLIGLPPSPVEVESFVNDAGEKAVETLVDSLLASPHFGERWGRHWLDLMRYAESRGHEFDAHIPNAYQYRDYVIRALNADVPYDKFVTEHIAGDLLEQPRLDATGEVNESVIGTGFWHLGEWVHSPVDIRLDETERVDNQIDVLAKTFLGLTVSCARCHDHKFDAISTKDYYSLAGIVESSGFRDVQFKHQDHNRAVMSKVSELDRSNRAGVARDFVAAQKPAIDRLADYLLAAHELIRAEAKTPGEIERQRDSLAGQKQLDPKLLTFWIAETQRAKADVFDPLHIWSVLAADAEMDTPERMAEVLKPALGQYVAEQERASKVPPDQALIIDYESPGKGQFITDSLAFGTGPLPAGSLLLGRSAERSIEVCETGSARSGLYGERLPGFLRTPTFTIRAPNVRFRALGSGDAFLAVDSHRMVAGPLHGRVKLKFNSGDKWNWQTFDMRPYLGQRAHLEFRPAGPVNAVAVCRVEQSEAAPPDPSRVNALLVKALTEPAPQSAADVARRYQQVFGKTAELLAADAITADAQRVDRARLANWLAQGADRLGFGGDVARNVGSELASFQKDRTELLRQIKDSPTAMAMLDGDGFDEHVLVRGSHKIPGEVAPRRLLEAIAGANQPPITSGSGRLELARRIVDPSNPFASRVMVNRVWHHLFGRGIVASVDNFGVMGQPPTHPELLDHLADRFVREGWSVKRLIRELVLSSTYQMSSAPSEVGDKTDPQNLLWHRMPIRRLEGEAIRDAILAVSGRLDRAVQGPSVEVYLTAFMEGRGRPNPGGPLDGAGRRSIYTAVRRNFLPPMMLAFDTPIPFNAIGRRTVSNVPAQALILMNDPLVIAQAQLWAKRVLEQPNQSSAARIDQMFRTALGRSASAAELTAAEGFLEQQAIEYGLTEAQRPGDPRLWTDLAHAIFNTKEFIFIE